MPLCIITTWVLCRLMGVFVVFNTRFNSIVQLCDGSYLSYISMLKIYMQSIIITSKRRLKISVWHFFYVHTCN